MRSLINSKPKEVDGHHLLTVKVEPAHSETGLADGFS
jgi:hypothetical protein